MASPIEAVLLLADAAQVDAVGKVHMLGAGWGTTSSPTAPQAVVGMIEVPWDRTNTPLSMRVHLVDADGQDVLLPGPSGEVDQRVDFQSTLEVGRPPGVPSGTSIPANFVVNVPPMPLAPGRYSWRLQVGNDHFLRSFQVQAPQAGAAQS